MDVQLPDGSVLQGVPDGTSKLEIARKLRAAKNPNGDVIAQSVMRDMESRSPVRRAASAITNAIGEPALEAISGTVGAAAGGLRGLYDIATGEDSQTIRKDIASTEHALTYQPKSAAGQAGSAIVNAPFALLEKGANKLGDVAQHGVQSVASTLGADDETARKWGAGAGTLVSGGVQAAPLIFGAKLLKGRAAGSAAQAAAEAEGRAKAYVARHTSLDWNRLPQAFRATLTKVAHDAKRLDGLDPKAVERQARLHELGLPATRGQVTRDLGQLTREENIAKSDAGAGVRNINAEQDRVLHEHLDTLRGQTGAKAQTPGQVGESVQGAARSRLATLRADYQAAYKSAQDSGAGLEPADISPLKQWLKNPTNRRNAGYLSKAIADYSKRGEGGKFIGKNEVSINNLEEIRKEATANTKKPGPEAHFAKEAVRVIDDILDKAGSAVYKDARTKFKAVKEEFDRQGRVAGLVKQKGMSRDRAVALEDTFDNIARKGSNEQLKAVKSTLTGDGSAKGTQAWKDLQGATIDHLKSAAAGKRMIPGEQGQMQFNSSFLDAYRELKADGKLDTLFGPGTTERLDAIAQATLDVRTKPTGRIAGSDTVPRLLSTLEKLSQIPFIGKPLAGAVGVAKKISDIGSEARESARAQTSPLAEEEQSAARAQKKAAKRKRGGRALGRAAVGGLTLRGDDTPSD